MASYLPILAAEDEETDTLLLRMAFKKTGLPNPLIVAPDGQVAIDYLTGAPPFHDRDVHPLPALLLLDLKMPRMNGFEVLAWLGERPELNDLPVVVFSSSSEPADMEQARRMGAREYLVKPHDFRQLTTLVQELARRWLVRTDQPVR